MQIGNEFLINVECNEFLFLARIMKSLITLANRLKFLAIEGQRRQIKLTNVKKGWREREMVCMTLLRGFDSHIYYYTVLVSFCRRAT